MSQSGSEGLAGGPLRVRRASDGAVVCARLAIARSPWQRMRGLIGRSSLVPGEGLYIATSSIHMMFMRFPIDALFVGAADPAGERAVVAIRPGLPPWRGVVWPVGGAKGVLELPAGSLEEVGVEVGQRLTFEMISEPGDGREEASRVSPR